MSADEGLRSSELMNDVIKVIASSLPADWEQAILECDWATEDVAALTLKHAGQNGDWSVSHIPPGVDISIHKVREQQISAEHAAWSAMRIALHRTFSVDVDFTYPDGAPDGIWRR